MNCEKGDLARILHIHAHLSEAAGRFVTCVELIVFNGEPAWRLDRRVEFVVTGNFRALGKQFWAGESVFFDQLQDKYLRPIRDPGEDAVDEVLRKVGHPLSESHRSITAPKPQKEFT